MKFLKFFEILKDFEILKFFEIFEILKFLEIFFCILLRKSLATLIYI